MPSQTWLNRAFETIFSSARVALNPTVKLEKYCFSLMVYMRKLESTVGLLDLLTILCAAISKAEGDH